MSNGWSAAITTPARVSAPGGDGAHYRPALRAGRPAAEMAKLARQLGIRLHSHLSETVDYLDAARQKFAMTPVQFCAEHDWLGNDVWFAHLVKLLPEECPAGPYRNRHRPLPAKQRPAGQRHRRSAGVRAGRGPGLAGVDGAASNEAADMQSEAHAAWLLQRARKGCWRSRATPGAPLRVGPMRPRWRM